MSIEVALLDPTGAVITTVQAVAARGLAAGKRRAGVARAPDTDTWVAYGDKRAEPLVVAVDVRLADADTGSIATDLAGQLNTLRAQAQQARTVQVRQPACRLNVPVLALQRLEQLWRGPVSVTARLSWLTDGGAYQTLPLTTDAGAALTTDTGAALYGAMRPLGGSNA